MILTTTKRISFKKLYDKQKNFPTISRSLTILKPQSNKHDNNIKYYN